MNNFKFKYAHLKQNYIIKWNIKKICQIKPVLLNPIKKLKILMTNFADVFRFQVIKK